MLTGYNGAEDVLKHNWFRNIQWQRYMYRKLKAPLIPEILAKPDIASRLEDIQTLARKTPVVGDDFVKLIQSQITT